MRLADFALFPLLSFCSFCFGFFLPFCFGLLLFRVKSSQRWTGHEAKLKIQFQGPSVLQLVYHTEPTIRSTDHYSRARNSMRLWYQFRLEGENSVGRRMNSSRPLGFQLWINR